MTGHDAACEFLREVLAAGPVEVAEVHRLALEHGIRPASADAARQFVGVRARRELSPTRESTTLWFLLADPESSDGEATPVHAGTGANDQIAHAPDCHRPAIYVREGMNAAGQYVIVRACESCLRRHVERVDWSALAQLGKEPRLMVRKKP